MSMHNQEILMKEGAFKNLIIKNRAEDHGRKPVDESVSYFFVHGDTI
jgi:hypothetical protein